MISSAFCLRGYQKLRNIPARPVIEPAIVAEGNKEAIAAELAGAAMATLDGKPDVALVRLKRRHGGPVGFAEVDNRSLQRLSAKCPVDDQG